ncbi:hypothetical protein D3C71_1921820 [compost metagenome]
MLASVPLSTTLELPEPLTVTPFAVAAVSVPRLTLRVTEMLPAPASMSATERPLSLSAVSSSIV